MQPSDESEDEFGVATDAGDSDNDNHGVLLRGEGRGEMPASGAAPKKRTVYVHG